MLIYKICSRGEWARAVNEQVYTGSARDREDGFIHFSNAEQVSGTLARYYAGQYDLLLAAVEADPLGDALKYEPSRDGALFPHLYGALPLGFVEWVRPIERKPDGSFVLPQECA